jgi:glutathione S-transferase
MRVYAAKVANPAVIGFVRDLRPIWLLEELGVAYEIVWLDRARDENRQAPYLAVNPFGKVPAIDDEGFRLYESGAICGYIGDKFGRLIPKAGTPERALFDQWMFCATTNIEPHATRIFASDRFFARNETTAAIRAGAVGELQRNLPVIDNQLSAQAHLLGPEFSNADIMMCTVLRMIVGSELLGPHLHVLDNMDRLHARPAFQRALAINGGVGQPTAQQVGPASQIA